MRPIRYLALLGCALAACDKPKPIDASIDGANTISFVNGVNGYAGTSDVSISTQYSANGVTTTSGELMAWQLTGASAYEERSLIRFASLPPSAGARVTSASLTLTFDNWSTGFELQGGYIAAAWNPTSSALGWLGRDDAATWATPGGDVVANPTLSFSGFSGNGVEVKTVALDPGIVQSWLDTSATNQGIELRNLTGDKVTRIYSSEDPDESRRPKLTITLSSAGGCKSGDATTRIVNSALQAQAGTLTASFDATPSGVIDGAVGIAATAAAGWSDLALIVRFNDSGTIDVRDGASYRADQVLPYAAGTTYHVRVPIDVTAHSYSVYVTPAGAAEQLVAGNFAFRTEQANITSLADWAIAVDSSTGSLAVCNFVAGAASGGGDTTPPAVAMTAPANGATMTGTVTLAATASDSVGVTGVQFLVDDAPVSSEVTAAPFTVQLDTTALANGSHSFSARARDAAGNVATASPVTATVGNSTTTGAHPRIWLDAATLGSLRAKAQAGAAQWTVLRNVCNGYLGGTVEYPDGNDYPNLPNIGEGYQGSDYFDPLLNIGLCYRIGLALHDANTQQWAQKGADILEKMSNPSHSPPFSRDDGYGIRFFGAGMAIGYDWLWDALPAVLRTQVYTQLNGWIAWFDANGFEHDHPQGNYFAGYYATKAYAGIATAGENGTAAAIWSDFLNRLHLGGAGSVGAHTGVAAYYAKYLAGGGWTEGWGYGPLASVNMSLPSLAARTAKGLDLIGGGYSYPLDNGLHLIHFSWPSLTSLDDRDLVHSGAALPAAPSSYATTVVAGLLGRWNHSTAPVFHSYARAIRAKVGQAAPWADFLFWDDSAAEAPYTTLPLSFFAHGLNTVAMRSDWGATATWASLRASAFVDYDGAAEQGFDAGALAIVRGGMPFVVNTLGFLDNTLTGSATFESQSLDELFSGNHPRRIYNTFYNGSTGQISVPVDASPAPATRVGRFEDGGSWVALEADALEAVYPASDGVSSWTRELVYLRPNQFVVYDRTRVSTISDEHLNWHVIATPAAVSATRWDVNSGTAGFMGAMTTVLPQAAQVSSVNVYDSNRAYRLEVRAPSPAADMRWLTVFDAAGSAATVATAAKLSSSANVDGTLLTSAGGNAAVLFGDSGAISGTVTFSEPAAATRVVLCDLAPSSSYSVGVSASGGAHAVTVQPGSGFTSSSSGTLAVSISASGAVAALH